MMNDNTNGKNQDEPKELTLQQKLEKRRAEIEKDVEDASKALKKKLAWAKFWMGLCFTLLGLMGIAFGWYAGHQWVSYWWSIVCTAVIAITWLASIGTYLTEEDRHAYMYGRKPRALDFLDEAIQEHVGAARQKMDEDFFQVLSECLVRLRDGHQYPYDGLRFSQDQLQELDRLLVEWRQTNPVNAKEHRRHREVREWADKMRNGFWEVADQVNKAVAALGTQSGLKPLARSEVTDNPAMIFEQAVRVMAKLLELQKQARPVAQPAAGSPLHQPVTPPSGTAPVASVLHVVPLPAPAPSPPAPPPSAADDEVARLRAEMAELTGKYKT